MSGGAAKMNTPALPSFNAGVFFFQGAQTALLLRQAACSRAGSHAGFHAGFHCQAASARLFQRAMKAVILAAGKGTRMGGLTTQLPKPMLRVQGKPILEHILTGLISAGIGHFFIVTGFRGEVIEDYFGDGKKWNVQISFGRQGMQDGTGKAPEVAKEFVGADDFILAYGDILVPARTYQDMLRRYGAGHYSGLVTCTGSEDVTKGGLFFFDRDFCLEKLVEKPTAAQLDELRRQGRLRPGDTAWYNAGLYIFRPLLFDFTARLEKSPRGEYELTDALTALLAAGHRLAGLAIQGRWVDVRDPQILAAVERGEPFDHPVK